MKNTPARPSTLRLNTANRLRGMLGIPLAGRPRKARPQVREQMVIEAIEPRVLLSAEALVLPPPPSEEVQVVTDAAEQARLSGQQALLLASGGGSQTIDLSSMAAASLIDQSARQSAESTRPNEVVFVDPRVADYRKFLDQALQGRGQAEQARVEVVVLDLASDGVDQIANWLGQYHDAPLQAVHILSHGETGALMIGSTVLGGDSLDAYADRLGRWATGLADGADPYEHIAVVQEDKYVQSLPVRRRDVAALVVRLAREYDVDPRLAQAIAGVESNFDRLAQSPKNARGVMQLIPETAARFNVRDPLNAEDNIRGGLAYLRWLHRYFKGDLVRVVAAYNAGEGAVQRYGGVPPYFETRAYVGRVLTMAGLGHMVPAGLRN